MSKDEVNFFYLRTLIATHRKLIGAITAGAAVVSLIVSLVLPPYYRAETKILPPQQGSMSLAAQLMSQMSGISTMMPMLPGMKNQNDMYIGILRSRTVLDKIVDRFGLMKLYDVTFREDARSRLDKALDASSGKDGMILVTVEDRNAKRAADMANAFVEEMLGVSKGLAITEAAQRRLFFEEQLKDVKISLAKAEEDMKGFQEKTGALKIDDQAKAVLSGIGNLRAQIVAREVQYKVAKTYATSWNPDLQRIAEELKGLKDELGKLERKGGRGYDPLMPTGRMPSVGLEFIRKFRDLKYYETLFELLAKQFELAKLDEARDAVIMQIVDPAVKPERKAGPKRALIVILSTAISFLLSIALVYAIENAKKSPLSPGKAERSPSPE